MVVSYLQSAIAATFLSVQITRIASEKVRVTLILELNALTTLFQTGQSTSISLMKLCLCVLNDFKLMTPDWKGRRDL